MTSFGLTPPMRTTDPSVFQVACFPYAMPDTFAMHPKLTALEGFTPDLNIQTVKLPTFGLYDSSDDHLTLMVFQRRKC